MGNDEQEVSANSNPGGESPVQRYFRGLAENTFQTQLGVADPLLIDYVSELLVRSVRNDVVHRIRSVTGQPLMTVAEMVAEASTRLGDAKRDLHQNIGDFTLFWAGLYPEALRDESDRFQTYRSLGKRSYLIASEIKPAREDVPSANLLQRLSGRFDLCCYGLREIRRQWETGSGQDAILLN